MELASISQSIICDFSGDVWAVDEALTFTVSGVIRVRRSSSALDSRERLVAMLLAGKLVIWGLIGMDLAPKSI